MSGTAEDRKKFEQWAQSDELNSLGGLNLQRGNNGEYFYYEVEYCWLAYQAGLKEAPPNEKLPCGCTMYWQRTRAFCKEHIHGLRCEQDYV